tara:strand:+ start:546 stop:4799 length:4254 start_codon:yes stop_codon:yes gene_type:complete
VGAWALPSLDAKEEPSSTRIRFTTLSKATPSGLKSDSVLDLVQDLSGYIWLATDNGLSQFDGWETENYAYSPDGTTTLSSNRLTAVAAKSKSPGPLWIGTASKGLMRFDQPSGTASWILKGSTSAHALLSDTITDLAISEDKYLWIATDHGLNVLNLATEKIVVSEGPLSKTPIAFVSCQRGSEVWVGTTAGELYKWNDTLAGFKKFWETSVPVTSVVADAENRVWIGTAGLGLYTFSPDSSDFPARVSFDSNHISALFFDSKANLWIGSPNGLALLNDRDADFTWFRNNPRHTESLTDNQVTGIHEDRSQMLWVTTAGGGTSRFSLDRQWFSHIRYNPNLEIGLPHPSVRSILPGNDPSILIATDQGLACWITEEARFAEPPVIPHVGTKSISHLQRDINGNLWISTRGEGLIRYHPDEGTEYYYHEAENSNSLGHDNVSVTLSNDDRTYIGTLGAGLWIHEAQRDELRRIPNPPGSDMNFVTTLSLDTKENLWVAAQSNVFLLKSGDKELTSFSEAFPQAEPLTSAFITTILPDRNGIVWLGTLHSGLDRFNTVTGEIVNFNSAFNGLPDDEVKGLIKDDNGFLWVVTHAGVARLDAMQNGFRVFSAEDGLQRSGFQRGAVTRSNDGHLYVGGGRGFNIIDPKNLPAIPLTPSPFLTSFEFFGEKVVPRKGGILEKEIAATSEVELPFDQRNRFALRFGNLDSRFPNSGHYRYMLKGYEYEWQNADETRKASYSSIPPGSYTFMVQSSLDGRDWPEESTKVDIRITPPWWETWWFRILGFSIAIFGTVGLTKFIIQSRVKQMQRRQQKLTAQRDKAEAELARQLQNKMLIERTTRELQNEVSEDQILDEPLEGITEQFHATHCIVHRLIDEDTESDIPRRSLKQIGYFGKGNLHPQGPRPQLTLEQSLVRSILETQQVVTLTDPSTIPDSIRKAFGDSDSISLISANTRFLDEANGLVTLLRVNDDRPWTDEDTKLLEVLTGQFGIAMAQLDTAATEERYRRHLESARHTAEVANRAKSDFLAKMTHELRTPLNAIIGFSEILGEDQTLNPRQRETLDIINNSGEHLLDVINEILDLSKIEAGKMEKNDESFEFVPMLKSVYEMLAMKADSKRIGFNFTAQSTMPGEVVTDRSKLRQILINLIGNAIKFTAQGAVSLSVRAIAQSEPTEVDHRQRRTIRIEFEVRDTGRGITEDELPKLFERYTQTESGRRTSEGTGLGLPIARNFIQLLDGDVKVESILGEGTVFRFHIECPELAPVASSSAHLSTALDENTAQRITGLASPGEEVRILIAEDQPTNRLLLTKILGKAGFALAEAKDGQEAVEMWNDWKPHLILMDEDMPIKKGSEATREIKSLATEDNDPVIVSLTAYALEQARISALEAGCSDFVAKPFRSHELFSVISKHLGISYVFNDVA